MTVLSAGYDHTQKGRLHLIVLLAAAMVIAGSFATAAVSPYLQLLMSVVGILLVGMSLCFTQLTVRDAGDHLAVRFGMVPLFGTKVAYDDVKSAAPAKSWVLDGWGIHWAPGRGWTFNLWGFDCVELELEGGRTMRVGTDDPEGLAEFLQTKVSVAPEASPAAAP